MCRSKKKIKTLKKNNSKERKNQLKRIAEQKVLIKRL